MSNIPHPHQQSAAESAPRRRGPSVLLAHFRREISAIIRHGVIMPSPCHILIIRGWRSPSVRGRGLDAAGAILCDWKGKGEARSRKAAGPRDSKHIS
jgi:hypothetical protein